MTHYVLTGAAPDFEGSRVLRDTLVAALAMDGHSVDSGAWDKRQVLVASRSGTVKARAAANLGCAVITYFSLYSTLSAAAKNVMRNPPETARPGWVDRNPRALMPNPGLPALASHRAKRARKKREPGEPLPIWHEATPEPPIPETVFDQSIRALQL